MSYQALARKWRPRRFSELVGQEHVVRALSHALDGGRIHHAFLFTGTRGVGKTTIARIFAKSLNCERGQSADPCGVCGVCTEVDAGRFVDLLEIDAASNTGIDNVRELIDNAQYSPSRGRYKVYLIDEVHMLSKSAFNALLKTLEEPPGHVKFLLATTDPQKLPVTVLSRCIKFNLKRLTPEQIGGQIRHILSAETIEGDAEAVEALARAADGSLRDGLSLLDQAIAHGGGVVHAADVHAMLGTVERGRVRLLLEAIAAGDGPALLAEIRRIAEFAPDFAQVLDELASLLHRIQLQQLVATVGEEDAVLAALAARLDPQDVQLWYQMAITGRRDLPLAPTPRTGFEMSLLRMLAFAPAPVGSGDEADGTPRATRAVPPPAAAAVAPSPAPAPAAPRLAEPASPAYAPPPAVSAPAAPAPPAETLSWDALIERAGLRGPLGQLAQHSVLLGIEEGQVRLGVRPEHEHLAAGPLVEVLEARLGEALERKIRVKFERQDGDAAESPAARRARIEAARLRDAEDALRSDPQVQSLIEHFDGRLVQSSIRPSSH
ncbi:DNA polymerase III subunit gamma/tau [Dokdonella koreensis]|uniref:DNA polymerase III subunit gamma/tau n=1 Tax=Dokdonella koreensis DS-123 TaxID=1300342 RepID=A0A160DV81_9GAMM|nr:DNA polymerase III subunit gamma/tau [Dokdonella koreensis]ANB18437.1 DNA polymerase III subunits gamma and tau [Dokdonella koreensis DS-123]